MNVLEVIKCLDDDSRIKLVYILSKYKFCQEHLVQILDINQANVSRNVNKLVAANILNFELTNRKNRYFVNQNFVDEYNDLHSAIMKEFDNSYLDIVLNELEEECEVVNEI